jgi:alginate O-acetyltransferase complex protein AlgI
MLFNSPEFWIFFIAVYILYLLLQKRGQNILLLLASYIFYATWNYKFLALIFISTAVDYFCGLKINGEKSQDKRKIFLSLSICCNLIILGFFKYYNFFIQNLKEMLAFTGLNMSSLYIDIMLPVGISFYTFQTMTYTIDIYRNELKPTRSFSEYALFVAFFPKLIAGPVERAKNLLPQIAKDRIIDAGRFSSGMNLILWGLFKKIFIADNLMRYADSVFALNNDYRGLEVVLGVYAYAFQIYCDFSGYTDIARGLSRLMGFELMENFRFPYFSKDPREFWQRWHISLSTWLRDYIYIPLGGSRHGQFKTYRNLMLAMIACGLWHGAAWQFVLWGIYQGISLSIHRWSSLHIRKHQFAGSFASIWHFLKVIVFFHVTCLGWLIFKADSLSQIESMLRGLIFNFSFSVYITKNILIILFFIWFLVFAEVLQKWKDDLEILRKSHWSLQSLSYVYMVFGIFVFGAPAGKNFIYFQF